MVDDTVTAKYLRGIGLIAADFGTARSYYLYNAHGDVTGLTDTSGTVTQKYDYDAFGNEQPLADHPTENDQNPFRYCGEYLDFESSMYYLRARYYSPTTGRFWTEDPAGAGLNWYTYCGNNPISFIDPFGLDAIWINDEQGASGFGHSSLLIQDEGGVWYHVNFGPYPGVDNDNMGNATVIVKEVNFDTVNFTIGDGKVNITKSDYTKKELKQNKDAANYYSLNRYFDKNEDSYIYLEGDFTKSLETSRYYVDNVPKYEFTARNCAWFSLSILQANYEVGSDMYKSIDKKLYKPLNWIDNLSGKTNADRKKRLVWPDFYLDDIEDLYNVKREVVPKSK